MNKYLSVAATGLMTLFVAGVLFASTLAITAPAHAANSTALTANDLFGGANYNGTDFAGEAGLGSSDLPTTIASIIRVILSFLGIVAVVIILLGGFKYMTAGGQDQKVQDAKKLIIAGIIGLAIILSAYAIASFVIGSLTTAIT